MTKLIIAFRNFVKAPETFQCPNAQNNSYYWKDLYSRGWWRKFGN